MAPAPAHALVLAAGLGTRLQPLTLARAKPAIPVAGEPLVRRVIRWLVSHGASDAVLNLHHLPDTITQVVGDGSDLDARVRYSWERPQILGSAGGPRLALGIVGADTFFIVNGDTLTDLDLGVMTRAHAASGALVTLALVPNRWPQRYGGVRVELDGRVSGFVRHGSTEPSHHFIGVQLVHASVFRPLAQGTPAQTIGGVYDELTRRTSGAIRGLVCEARFWDIGTPADYWATSLEFLRSEGGWQDARGRDPRISASARVERSILWDDVEVGAGASLDECIVTDGVAVAPGSTYRRAMLVRPKGGDALIVSSFA